MSGVPDCGSTLRRQRKTCTVGATGICEIDVLSAINCVNSPSIRFVLTAPSCGTQ